MDIADKEGATVADSYGVAHVVADGQVYISSPYQSNTRICQKGPPGSASAGQVVRYILKLQDGVAVAEDVRVLKGKPEEVMKNVRGKLLLKPSMKTRMPGLLEIYGDTLHSDGNLSPALRTAAEGKTSQPAMFQKFLDFGLPMLYTDQRRRQPCEGDTLEFTIYRYPGSEFYFAKGGKLVSRDSSQQPSRPPLEDKTSVTGSKEDQEEAILEQRVSKIRIKYEMSRVPPCTFTPQRHTQPTLTIVTGDSHDGSAHLHAFDLFRKSAFFRSEYLYKDALSKEIVCRVPRPCKESDFVWPASTGGRVDDCLYKPAPVRDIPGEDDWAMDPVACNFTEEGAAALGAALNVSATVVWECDAWGTRGSSDRTGASYFARLSEQWSFISRAGNELALDSPASVLPVQPLSQRTQSLLQHVGALDRRTADTREFDMSSPEVQDQLHTIAVQKARMRRDFVRLQERVSSRSRTSITCSNSTFRTEVRHFLGFLRAHNENVERMQALLRNSGLSDDEVGGMDAQKVHDPMLLVQKCAKFRLCVIFSEGSSREEPVTAEEVARWPSVLQDDKDCQSDRGGYDTACSDIADLIDRTRSAHTSALNAEVRVNLAYKPRTGIWKDQAEGVYIEEVAHFRAFLEAHNAHVRAFQGLLNEPDDLNVIQAVPDIAAMVAKCERFKLHRFFGCRKTSTAAADQRRTGLPLELATSPMKRRCPSKWKSGGKESLRSFWKRHAEVHRQFVLLAQRAEEGVLPVRAPVVSEAALLRTRRSDARLRDALLLCEQVRDTLLSCCAVCRDCFVASDLYHPASDMFPEQAVFITVDLPNLPPRQVHRWVDPVTGEALMPLPIEAIAVDGGAGSALRWALGESNHLHAYHLLFGDRCSVKFDFEKKVFVVSVTRWGISVQRTCSFSTSIRDDEAFVGSSTDSVQFVLGTGLNSSSQVTQKRRVSVFDGVERWVWSRYPWRRMKYSTLMLHERLSPEHPFAWTFIPVEKRRDVAGKLTRLASIHGKGAVMKVLQNFAVLKSPSLRGAVARWMADVVHNDYIQSQAIKLCQQVEDALVLAAPMCRELAGAGVWKDSVNWWAQCQEKPFLVAPKEAEDEYRNRPGSVWEVQEQEGTAPGGSDVKALMTRVFNQASFRSRFRLRRGCQYQVVCEFLAGRMAVTYAGPEGSVSTSVPIEWKRRAVPLVFMLKSSELEIDQTASTVSAAAPERLIWLRHPWRRVRYSDTVRPAVPAVEQDCADDPVLWTLTPPQHPRIAFCEHGSAKLDRAALAVMRALMREIALLPAAIAPRRIAGLSGLPARTPREKKSKETAVDEAAVPACETRLLTGAIEI